MPLSNGDDVVKIKTSSWKTEFDRWRMPYASPEREGAPTCVHAQLIFKN
jgi:hypothetical protein